MQPKDTSAGERAAAFVVQRRFPVFALTAVTVLALSAFILGLDVNNSSDIWFEEDDPIFRKYLDFMAEFGSDSVLVIACLDPDPFGKEALERLKNLSGDLAAVEHVDDVASLATVPVLRREGMLPRFERLLDRVNTPEEELHRIRRYVQDTGVLRGHVVSEDGKVPLVVVKSPYRGIEGTRKLIKDVRAVLDRYGARRFRMAGIPILDAEFDRLSTRENRIFIPISLGLVFVVMVALFRSMRVALASAAVVFCSLGITIGIFAAADRTFNLVTSLVPPLIVAIGIADTVHILRHYTEELGKGKEPRPALRGALRRMFVPCLFTSLTTSVGFLSLTVADIRPVREAGIFGALGIMCAFALSFGFFPALVTFIPARVFVRSRPPGGTAARDPLGGVLTGLSGLTVRFRWPVILAAGALAAGAIFGVARIQPETFVLKFFREGNQVRQDWEFLERQGVGLSSAQLVLEGPPGAFAGAEGLSRVEEVQKAVEGFDLVARSVSVADLARAASAMLGETSPTPETLAALIRMPVPQLRSAWEGYLSPDRSRARVSLRLKGASDRVTLDFIEAATQKCEPLCTGPYRLTVTGAAVVFSELNRILVKSQEKTALTAVTAICVAMIVLLRAPLLGLLGMVPNLLPILVTLGLMGWVRIPLDVGTMIIAGVALGIAVDDTIHYLTRFRREVGEASRTAEALRICHLTVGKALVYTSFILFCGFIVIGLSSFRPVLTFGLLTGLTMIFALVGDLVVLPAMLAVLPSWMTRRKARNG
jgi:predicted RND superfamily exporter protein